jgi:FlgD Ig-like domain
MRFRLLPLLVLTGAILADSPASATIEIIDVDEVRRMIEVTDGIASLEIDGTRWELITDPASPAISSLGDGSFHPMDRHEVQAALAGLRSNGRLPHTRIYILPFPRREILRSSCHGHAILLSPGIRAVSREHVHMTVVHELGHVVQHAMEERGPGGWQTYLELRDLDPVRFHAGAAHRDRPAEIFAEDFRFLMGGALATASGSIENPALPTPDQVPGLSLWFRRGLTPDRTEPAPGEVGPQSFPNPFRASTSGRLSVRFVAPAGFQTAPAAIYDLQGRLVRSLDAPPADRDGGVTFRWDGRDRTGQRVASGTYLVTWAPCHDQGAARVQVLH